MATPRTRLRDRTRRAVIVPASAMAIAGLATGCGGSHSSKTSTASTGSPTAQITQDWSRFFSGSTPASARVSLLQNGQQYATVMKAQAASPLAKEAQATVSKVHVIGPDRAQVTYSILVAGKPVLKDQIGTAVKSGGTWKVSDASFCQLLKLEGGAPPSCAKA